MRKSISVIALDFDGTIALGREEAKVEYAKLYHGIEISAFESIGRTYPLGREKYGELRNLVDKNFNNYRMAPDCKEVLDKLYMESFRFAIVTGRNYESMDSCYRFVEENKLPIDNLYCTNEQPKAETCLQIEAKAMLDDTIKELLALKGTGIRQFLYSPMQQMAEGGIVSAGSWKEFRRLLYVNL